MYAHSRPVHHAWHAMVRFFSRSCRCMHDEPAAACVVGRAPWSSFSGHAARPRWPNPRHAKSHRLERLRRMVALQRRGYIDPRWLWNGVPPKPGHTSGAAPVKVWNWSEAMEFSPYTSHSKLGWMEWHGWVMQIYSVKWRISMSITSVQLYSRCLLLCSVFYAVTNSCTLYIVDCVQRVHTVDYTSCRL
jgi:hypothetical protein